MNRLVFLSFVLLAACTSPESRNIAFQRAARHSSAFDVNQTAQLVTDGYMADEADFHSTWKSAGNTDEWIEVDLGETARLDKAVFHWINAPQSGTLMISKDGSKWRKAGSLTPEMRINAKARYVKAVLDSTANGEPFELEEWEILGKAKPMPANSDWKLIRASALKDTEDLGERLSSPDYDDSEWLPAIVPGTVLGSYVAAGAVPDPNYEANQLYISDSYFHSDFWYRHTFEARLESTRQFLHFDGINYKARIWLNGQYVGGIESAFDAARFDVTDIIRNGTNVLAPDEGIRGTVIVTRRASEMEKRGESIVAGCGASLTKIAAFAVTLLSPANQSWMNGRTPRRSDILRLARPATRPRFSTRAVSSSR